MYTRLAFCGWKWERSARWLPWAMKTMIELFVRVLGMCEAMLDEERLGDRDMLLRVRGDRESRLEYGNVRKSEKEIYRAAGYCASFLVTLLRVRWR